MQAQVLRALQQGKLILTATRRLARCLQLEYNQLQQSAGLKAWESPAIMTWGGWIESLWQDFLYSVDVPRILMSRWQELMVWEQIIREAPEAGELLQLHVTASTAQQAWRLACEYRLDLAQIEKVGNEESRAFTRWVRRFQEICSRSRWIEKAVIPDLLRADMGRLNLPPGVLLAGFDDLTPQQREFFGAAAAAGCSVEDLDPAGSETGAHAVRISFPSPEAEIETAARWTRALLESGVTGGIGIVVTDLTSRRNMIERIFTGILDPAAQLPGHGQSTPLVNISAGASLSGHPMIRSAFAILSLSPDENEWNLLSDLLRNRYIQGSESEGTNRALLDAHMRQQCGNRVSSEHLRRLCRSHAAPCPLFEKGLAAWSRAAGSVKEQTAGEWSRTFSLMLEAFGWPGDITPSSPEFQTMQAWSDLLSTFASTGMTQGTLTRYEALSVLRRIAGETMFQPETGDVPVQILGTLEASGIRFTHLWVAGLHDEVWPGAANPNPFLPIQLQREKGVPRCSPERELEFSTRITRRLLDSGSNIVLSCPVRIQDREVAPSPLIAWLPEAAAGDLNLWNGPAAADAIRDSRKVERLVDEKGPPLAESAWQRGGSKVFQYQSLCPFRAFAELRLGAERMEDPVPGLDARQRGILVHSVLEEIWKQLRTHEALCSASSLPEIIVNSVDTAMARLEEQRGIKLPKRFAALERGRLVRLTGGWLEFEKRRAPFEVVQPEGERYAELSGIRFKVKIDRIDRLPDGRDVIIDYKTGNPTLRYWETDRPEEPQLPLYSTIHESPLAGVLFAQIRIGELRFIGLVDDGVEMMHCKPVDLAESIRCWRAVLEKLGSDFRAGRAEADPKKADSCRYCGLAYLCRISEAERLVEQEEME